MTEHIVQIVQHLRPGGIECMALDLARRSRVRTTVISLEGRPEDCISGWGRLRREDVPLAFFDKPAGRHLEHVWRLSRVLRRMEASVVHTHHIGPLLYGGLAARLAGVPTVVHTEHDAWHLDAAGRRYLENALLRVVRPHLVADSALVADAMRQALGERPITVVDNGIDTDRFRPADQTYARRVLGLPGGAPIIGTAARLEMVKGVDILMEAVARLPKVRLAVAGGGSQADALRRRAERLGIDERVHFFGPVDNVPMFHTALDRFCLASRHEGLPLSMLEAQACGVPVIVTPVGAMAYAACPRSGSVATEVSPEAMAEAISASLSRTYPADIPRHHVQGRFSLDTMMNRYEEIWHGRPAEDGSDLAAA